MVFAESKLALRADHAVRGVAIGLARRDREPTGQHSPWECHDDAIASCEVPGPADDPADSAVHGSDIDLTPANGLLELRQLLDHDDMAKDECPDNTFADRIDGLHLKPGTNEVLGNIAPALVCGDLDELSEPRNWGTHYDSKPNARVNLMSPSTMSRMSVTPLRNMRVRSIPMPNANPR
ncbi:unannotated protein [freshwater metagenome]|uniref:Unannotated protein n=1 Tax=freshwater metagenome TaxID=449393 RepID=A0A6J7IY00_9ZZZZ